MKIFIMCLLVASFFISCISPAQEPSNQFRVPYCSPIVRNLPIFPLHTKLAAGTKDSSVVLVGPGTWATSSHGINHGKDIEKITITLRGGINVDAKLIWFDKAKDIATLSAKSYKIRPIDPMSYNIADLEQVWNIGYAGMANGELMSFTGFKVRYRKDALMIVNALAYGGMSGGATVRCVEGHLELVGIITALVQHAIELEVWTDKTGIIHQRRTLINSGQSIISPMKFQSSE